MQARKLRALLNDTGYNIADYGEYIAVGSGFCHQLIKVDKITLEITYALDRGGRSGIKHKPLEEIRDKLQELIKAGQMREIISGVDEIENPIPVYSVVGSTVVTKYTESMENPVNPNLLNTTHDGEPLYKNQWFATEKEAIKHEIGELECTVEFMEERLLDEKKKVQKLELEIQERKHNISELKKMR